MVKYIYGGNHSFLVSTIFSRTGQDRARVSELYNDRYSYFLTFQQWAEISTQPPFVVDQFGEFNCRRFRLYLWGAAYEFLECKQ